MCSVATGQCPSSSVSGWQFNSHYDCINAGYGVAQKTFQNLSELEEQINSTGDWNDDIESQFKDLVEDFKKTQTF